MFTILRSVAVAAALLVPSSAFAVVIDFDALDSDGLTSPLTTFTEDGYTFALSYSPVEQSLGPIIFSTFCRDQNGVGYKGNDKCNNDIDLVPGVADLSGGIQGQNGVAGNILVLQDDETVRSPNDDRDLGNSITFTLLSGEGFLWRGFSAVDDGTYTASTLVDGILGTIDNGAGSASNNRTGSILFAASSSRINVGDSFTILWSNSGGIDSLVLAPVPVPAALPLMLAAVGGLGVLRLRRRKA